MYYTINKSDFGKICRTCLSQKENMSLLFTKELLKMFRSLTKLKVTKTDGLPELICSDCSEQVNRSYNFKLLCENSNRLLQQINRSDRSMRSESRLEAEEKKTAEPAVTADVDDACKAEFIIMEQKDTDTKAELSSQPSPPPPEAPPSPETPPADVELKSEHGEEDDSFRFDDDVVDDDDDDDEEDERMSPIAEVSVSPTELQPKDSERQSITGMRVRKAIMMGPEKCDPTTLTCKICDKALVNIYSLGRHMEMHDERREFRHKCRFCGKGFYEKGQLTKHVRRHRGETRYECELCSKGFYELSAVAVHMKKHKVKPTPCPTCSKQFYVRRQLEIHVAKKHPTDRHVCAKCGKEFQNARYLQVHQLVHVEVRMFSCLLCDKSFKNDESLRKHHKRVHVDEPKLEICIVCGKAVKLMKTHLMKHSGERPFKCERCPRAYLSKSQLKTHCDVKHGDGAVRRKYPFLCSVCGKPCQTTTQLRNHARKHTGERPFDCRLCEKKYKTNGALTIHLRSHTEERPYVCDVCHKGFYTSTILKHHVRTHTGERPHKCEICGRAFSQNSSLKTHMKVH